MSKRQQRTRINEDISAPQVRLVGENREQFGICDLVEALGTAQKAGLDLVEIVPDAEPPVCRIMDFGKFRFEQKKKYKQQQQAQRRSKTKIKTIQMRPNTDVGDYEVKLRNLLVFIEEDEAKVKVVVKFRGREIAHHELGFELLKRLEADVGERAQVEVRPKMEGRQLTMLFAPIASSVNANQK